MKRKVYNTTTNLSKTNNVREPIPIHLRMEACLPNDVSGVCAYDNDDLFSAKPLEISPSLLTEMPTDLPVYDPNDVHIADNSRMHSAKPSSYAQRVASLLVDFSEKSKAGEWPISTSTLCHWCCHAFDDPPVGIPIRFDGKMFLVKGCFCSLACAAAYNIESGEGTSTILNRHSLLCSLAYQLVGQDDIKCAPPRLSLACFGGHMDIKEFRSFSDNNCVIIINTAPMKSLEQQIEEVGAENVGSGYEFIPIEHVRNERGLGSELMLKRNKPLINVKNTLHSAMKVQIVQTSV